MFISSHILASHSFCVLFFFQAEDGIRDVAVTGVQTCALPISSRSLPNGKDLDVWADYARAGLVDLHISGYLLVYAPADARWSEEEGLDWLARRETRSEERRVGKEGRSRGAADVVKKKEKMSTR